MFVCGVPVGQRDEGTGEGGGCVYISSGAAASYSICGGMFGRLFVGANVT